MKHGDETGKEGNQTDMKLGEMKLQYEAWRWNIDETKREEEWGMKQTMRDETRGKKLNQGETWRWNLGGETEMKHATLRTHPNWIA